MLEVIIIISLLSATVIFLAYKWGFINWVQMHYFDPCIFCVGFWVAVLFTLTLLFTHEFNYGFIGVPLASASLTYLIVKNIL
jgi:hypothetical protein